MPTWLSYVLYFAVIFVALAPRRILGPVVGLAARFVGVRVVALVSLGAGCYLLSGQPSPRDQWIGLAELALAAACVAFWIYRLFVPAFRDQTPEDEQVADDR